MSGLPDFIQFKPTPPTPFKDIFTAAGDDLLDLIESLLHIYPPKRCNCTEALKMPYFR